MQYFGYLGIIMASVISSYLNLTLLTRQLLKKGYFFFEKYFYKNFLITLTISVIMLIFLIFLKKFWQNFDLLDELKLAITITSSVILYFGLYQLPFKNRQFNKIFFKKNR
jgi:peptidoglycan biosynthesis protein MviN/MurJ (putative lipid II flippase)